MPKDQSDPARQPPPMINSQDESHPGVLAPLFDRAKKVLFPETKRTKPSAPCSLASISNVENIPPQLNRSVSTNPCRSRHLSVLETVGGNDMESSRTVRTGFVRSNSRRRRGQRHAASMMIHSTRRRGRTLTTSTLVNLPLPEDKTRRSFVETKRRSTNEDDTIVILGQDKQISISEDSLLLGIQSIELSDNISIPSSTRHDTIHQIINHSSGRIPHLTPGSSHRRKRMDIKMTPDKILLNQPIQCSPLVTEMSVTPKLNRRRNNRGARQQVDSADVGGEHDTMEDGFDVEFMASHRFDNVLYSPRMKPDFSLDRASFGEDRGSFEKGRMASPRIEKLMSTSQIYSDSTRTRDSVGGVVTSPSIDKMLISPRIYSDNSRGSSSGDSGSFEFERVASPRIEKTMSSPQIESDSSRARDSLSRGCGSFDMERVVSPRIEKMMASPRIKSDHSRESLSGDSRLFDVEAVTSSRIEKVIDSPLISSDMEFNLAEVKTVGEGHGFLDVEGVSSPHIESVMSSPRINSDQSRCRESIGEVSGSFDVVGVKSPWVEKGMANKFLRGSVVLSVKKAEPPHYDENSKAVHVNHTKLEGGPRRPTTESKKTNRLMMSSWDDNRLFSEERIVRFGKTDLSEVHSTNGTQTRGCFDVVEAISGQINTIGKGPVFTLLSSEKSTESMTRQESSTKVEGSITSSLRSSSVTTQTPRQKSVSTSLEANQWSNEDVDVLRHAHLDIDPTSCSYWEEVASLVHGKSASECRDKWFSLVATPKGRAPKPTKKPIRNSNPSSSAKSHKNHGCPSSPQEDEDDLFDSTPLRDAVLKMPKDGLAEKFPLSVFASFGLSPRSSALSRQNGPHPNERRRGYKTYVDNLRKDLRLNLRKGSERETRAKPVGSRNFVVSELGESGKLFSDGTFQINAREDREEQIDDFLDEEDEE